MCVFRFRNRAREDSRLHPRPGRGQTASSPIADTSAGRLVPVGDAPAREGAGPRHVALHPSNAFAYAVNELDSTVTAYRFEPEAGNLHPFEVVSALPDTFIGHSRAAEITVSSDGRFVYASNRGHDGIATLAVDPASGRLARRTGSPVCIVFATTA
jgi:6-phosphogluconolactonase (cycloisomerase 2 family)